MSFEQHLAFKKMFYFNYRYQLIVTSMTLPAREKVHITNELKCEEKKFCNTERKRGGIICNYSIFTLEKIYIFNLLLKKKFSLLMEKLQKMLKKKKLHSSIMQV